MQLVSENRKREKAMILWTIQDIAVWKQLEEMGVYTTPTVP